MRGRRGRPRALSIAGSDSSGGAGVQADVATFAAVGVFATSAVTAVTVQDSLGVHAVHVLEPRLVRAQIDAVLDDLGADAVKTGMLGTRGIVAAVAASLAGVASVAPLGGGIRVVAKDATAVLPPLLEALLGTGLRPSRIELREPDLEAVFLRLTGRALRD